jgi:hypothetical protein
MFATMHHTGKIMFIVALILCSTSGHTQGLFENATNQQDSNKKFLLDIGGYGRGSAYGLSPSYDYNNVFAEFAFQGKLSLKRTFLYTDLRFRYGMEFNVLGPTFELKETYVGYQSPKLDLYLGAKIITWGRCDGFNPTDNITPYNYFFLTANPDDQKLSNFLMHTRWHITPALNLELVLIPYYRPSVYRYDLFDLGDYTTFTAPTWPAKTFENGSIAGRFNADFSGVGFSASYFRGFDPYYGFTISSFTMQGLTPQVQLTAKPYQKSTFGADLSVPIGSWIIRAEGTYTHTNDYDTNMYIPNPGFYYVAGVEYSFWNIVAILQYIGHYTLDFVSLDDLPPPQTVEQMVNRELTSFNRKIFYQEKEANHALSLSMSRSFLHETLSAQATGYYNFTSEEWFVRPKIAWKITDHLETSLGGFYSYGPDQSLYYYASDIFNGVFLELKATF